MSSEVASGLTALLGVVVGAVLTASADKRLWRQSEIVETRLVLADTFGHIWAEQSWGETEVHLERLRTRLDVLGVDEALFENLRTAVRKCRGSIERQREERSFEPEIGPGLSYERLGEYRKAVDDIAEALRGRRGFRWRRPVRGLPKAV